MYSYFIKNIFVLCCIIKVQTVAHSDLSRMSAISPDEIFFVVPICQHDNEENIGIPRPIFRIRRKPIPYSSSKWRWTWKGPLSLRRRRSNPMVFLG